MEIGLVEQNVGGCFNLLTTITNVFYAVLKFMSKYMIC